MPETLVWRPVAVDNSFVFKNWIDCQQNECKIW
jgi:hypothetical protein